MGDEFILVARERPSSADPISPFYFPLWGTPTHLYISSSSKIITILSLPAILIRSIYQQELYAFMLLSISNYLWYHTLITSRNSVILFLYSLDNLLSLFPYSWVLLLTLSQLFTISLNLLFEHCLNRLLHKGRVGQYRNSRRTNQPHHRRDRTGQKAQRHRYHHQASVQLARIEAANR